MDGARKTAVLLLSLDQAAAAALLRKLPRDQVERVTLAIANAERVTREEQEQILNEFKSAFASRPLIQPVGPETARELLEQSLDQADIEPMQTRIDEQIHAGPFAFLHNRHADDIRRLIENEHSQTIAVVVAQLPPDLAAQVLAGFPADARTDFLGRVARLGPADATALAEIAAMLNDRIGPVPIRTGGVLHAADVLRESSPAMAQKVLGSIQQQDTNLGDMLRGSLFPFQQIESFADATMRVVLQNTNDCRWAMAIKGTSETLRQRVLGALPATLAKALADEMNSIGPIRLSEITAAQTQIVEAILSLESDNEIDLPKNTTRPQRLRRFGLATDAPGPKAEMRTAKI